MTAQETHSTPEFHAHPAPELMLRAAAAELPEAKAPEARSMLSGLACLRQLPLATAAVLIVQDPDATHAHTRSRRAELGRRPGPGQRPSVLPAAGGGVAFFYDERQTVAAGPGRFCPIEPVAEEAAVRELIAGLPSLGIAVREDREIAVAGGRVLDRRLDEVDFVPGAEGRERGVVAEVVLTDSWSGLPAGEQLRALLLAVARVLDAGELPARVLDPRQHARAEHRLDAEGVTKAERRRLLAAFPLALLAERSRPSEAAESADGDGAETASARLAAWLAAARLGHERDYPADTHAADLGATLRVAARLEELCLGRCANTGVSFPEGEGENLLAWWRGRLASDA